ncbi:N-acyl-D-amino-acid deacylase family protein [Labrys neptuniae]|uniref:D-aminoacylase n=1 Tax=Labrys neptuniae TaxID=376174 RepID=A0ABV3PTW0_9HYPH
MTATCDLIFRQAKIFDGTGATPHLADVAVTGERVVALGEKLPHQARTEIDAAGLALAPGFIDVHTHDDRAVIATDMAAKLSQGVTTVVVGNCGISLAPLRAKGEVVPPLDLIAKGEHELFERFADYFEAVEAAGTTVNVTCLVGHTTLRLATMDRLDRPATRAECARMRDLLDQALADGAIGLSTGLYYQPANAASTAEVIAVAEPLAKYSAIYTTHLRDEADHLLEAMEEAFAIGREADAPVVLSHHKATDPQNHGRTRVSLPIIEKRAREQPVTLDVYPYAASSTVLEAKRAGQVERILITWSKARPDLAGKTLDVIARELGVSREEAVAKLQPAGAVYFTMDEEDVRRVLQFPLTMVGSDGLPHDVRPHPRLWGTFPRVLGHYARDIGLFGMEEAVRRMTALPAARFGLAQRGVIRQGAYADLVLFDPETIQDKATFDDPTQLSAGIRSVYVNGSLAWSEGKAAGPRAGKVLRNRDLVAKNFTAAFA